MKIKYNLYLVLFVSILIGCEDQLDTKTTWEIDDEYTWRIPDLAEGVLLKAYEAIHNRPDSYDDNFLDCATDNALTSTYSSNLYKTSQGGITLSDNPLGNWSNCYTQLQYINSFLENGLTEGTLYNREDEDVDQAIKERLEGEAYFLRAWWHFELLKMYGGKATNGKALGYPIADHFVDQEEASDFSSFKRNTYAECVKQIVEDLDAAIELLPTAYTGSDDNFGEKQIGRANAMSAAVLKARVLLYAASPAMQDDAVTLITGMGTFNIVDQETYQKQWEAAALAMNDILLMDNFGSYTALQATQISDAPNTTPADFVFRRYFNNFNMEQLHFPPFYYGNARTIPSHNLVKAFPTIDGFPQGDTRTSWSADEPYTGLDKRFELIINYHGRNFGNSGVPLDMSEGGKDSPEYYNTGSRSGYYLAKFMSKQHGMLNPTNRTNVVHYNPLLRKSEVFLNFAEASNEAWGPYVKGPGCTYSAYEIIKDIRQKSGGITDVTYLDEMAASQDTFRELIQNERRLEFAFESHRYYDMRRWILPLNEDIYGIEVTIDSNDEPVYTVRKIEQRIYDDRHYFSPIPYNEVAKNPLLINNRGWQ